MNELRYILVSDGSSDISLLRIIDWVLAQKSKKIAVYNQWADFRGLPNPPKGLSERILRCMELYGSCDILFIHRDAEREPRSKRVREIEDSIARIKSGTNLPPYICVVPVRMKEAWLLFDTNAIRQAAGNPNGRISLKEIPVDQLEKLPDPKQILYELLRNASGLSGRRRRKFNVARSAIRIAQFIQDFSPLRKLPAFQQFESELYSLVEKKGWV